jgi:uncharacterized protein with ParB-like and HNH nuclease domain
MSKKISGAEYPLSKIFSSDFEYIIPSYQRPYAWGVDQASELFDDLLAFHQAEDEEGYFLGSIVLIKSEAAPRSEVIDGQQRLTTLTMLLASMAAAHCGEYKGELQSYIIEPGKKLEKIRPKSRLSLRDRDQSFFAKYIQSISLDALIELDPSSLDNESQVNIHKNIIYFVDAIQKHLETPEALGEFVTFLLTRCYLVVVSTPTQESAFRVFSVMNNRGLDLQPTDIIKADTIGKLKSEKERQEYNDKWEEMEVELGRSKFNDLFTYIRMIFAKEKAKRSLLEEFRKQVLTHNPDSKKFIDEVLEPFADALENIKEESYVATANAEVINYYIGWLNRIDNSDWIPPAMLFLKKHRNKSKQVARFFELLERLAAYLHICRHNVNWRIEIYSHIMSEIEEGKSPDNIEWLDLDEDEKEEFRNALDGNIYDLPPRKRNYLILRLDSFISDGAASYDPKLLTVEHVLPQTVTDANAWQNWWPVETERKGWLHRIANLVPLNKKKNSSAQNYDFEKKCKIYFSGTENVSSYALTSQVISQKKWTPQVVEKRQKELLGVLIENWALEES